MDGVGQLVREGTAPAIPSSPSVSRVFPRVVDAVHPTDPEPHMNGTARSLVGIVVSVSLGLVVAFAAGDGGARAGGLPVAVWCALGAFAVNWVAFVPAWRRHDERFYDLVGSLTYLSVLVLAVGLAGGVSTRGAVLVGLVAVWTLRLGSFLFRRVHQDGGDGRFDRIKYDALAFLSTWTVQGLWVVVTAAAALAAIADGDAAGGLDAVAVVGIAVWVAGFAVEVVADRQKRAFRRDPANRGRFITTGLWAWSRHPNYFGEITLWAGVALIALGALDGWQYATLISPIFVFLLITRVSGVPLLEARATERWGDDPEFQAYVERTPVLVLRPPRP